MPNPGIRMPDTAGEGAEIGIRARIMHPMESGRRTDSSSARVPRDMLRRFVCRFEGETVAGMELHESVSADPFVQFSASCRGRGDSACCGSPMTGASSSRRAISP